MSVEEREYSPNNEPEVSPELIGFRELIELQHKEADVRAAEMEVRAAEVAQATENQAHQKEVALVSIAAQKDDRTEGREAYSKESTKTKWFSIGVLLIVLTFIYLLVLAKQAEMAMELIKTVSIAVLGGFGGYGYARWKTRDNKESEANGD